MNQPVVPFGRPRPERADALRNRETLLCTARTMMAEGGADSITMDALAERSGLGKGTVFRRFGTRAGIFRALLDEVELEFQRRVLYGPPPLGPGADAAQRMIAYGRARIEFLLDHQVYARAGLERSRPVPAGDANTTTMHLAMLLANLDTTFPEPYALSIQLTAALEGPILLYLAASDSDIPADSGGGLSAAWQDLVERLLTR